MHAFHRAFLFVLSPRWRLVGEIEAHCCCLPECVCRAAARLAPRWVLGGQRGLESEQRGGWAGPGTHLRGGSQAQDKRTGAFGAGGPRAVLAQQEKKAFAAARPRERRVREACAAEMRAIRGPDSPQDCCRSAHQLWVVCAVSVRELGD